MSSHSPDLQIEFARLFEEARAKNGLNHLYTVARVTGFTHERDPMLVLRDLLGEIQPSSPTEWYRSILPTAEEAFVVLVNLVRCRSGDDFDGFPFRDLLPMAFLRRAEDRQGEVKSMAARTAEMLHAAGYESLAVAITEAFAESPVTGQVAEGDLHARVRRLLGPFLSAYEHARRAFKDQQTLHRLPQFTVLEVLTDEAAGLRGFKLHFSNGTSAHFIRRDDGTEAVNLTLGVPLEFSVGLADQLRDEWRVGDKRLHEIGLPGRYNALGEWKPLAFPGNADPLLEEARAASDNADVQGAVFYMLCTGHRVLEFAARMTAELPGRITTYADSIHLYLCNPTVDTEPRPTLFVYDGWAELPDPSPDTILQTLDRIARFFNRTALALDTGISWRPKYSLRPQGGEPFISDTTGIRLLNEFLGRYQEGPDAEALDIAIDWYTRGSASGSPFTAFLCFYIAIESVANAVFAGDADLGLEIASPPLSKAERQEARATCIETKLRELYETDPTQFVERAYFDCVKGTTQRTREVIAAVFGEGSRQWQRLFSSEEGESLADLRSHLAHGAKSELSPSEARIVRDRVSEVRRICREFLTRLLLRLRPDDPVPDVISRLGVGISFRDPRNLQIVSSVEHLSEDDWSIKPDWISWR